ncbi:MAG TPA: radical SAM protein [Acidobacteriota bacterium]
MSSQLTPIEPTGRFPLSPLIGPALEVHRGVEYAELNVRALLNRCSKKSAPFFWTINPYRGCEFGCAYCFARYTHDFLGYENWLAFERRIFVKQAAPAALRRDLRHQRIEGRSIAIGTATDPYQPAERHFGVTRAVLTELARHRGLDLSITTKGALVTRDLELLQQIHRRSRLWVHFSITTLNPELARRLEPRAPTPAKRFEAMAALAAGGIQTALFLMPVVPAISDRPPDLRALIARARAAGALEVHAAALHLRRSAQRRFYPWLRDNFPERLQAYRRAYGSDAYAPRAYRARLAQIVRAACRKHGWFRRRAGGAEVRDARASARPAFVGWHGRWVAWARAARPWTS